MMGFLDGGNTPRMTFADFVAGLKRRKHTAYVREKQEKKREYDRQRQRKREAPLPKMSEHREGEVPLDFLSSDDE